jgi:hypothetical protein
MPLPIVKFVKIHTMQNMSRTEPIFNKFEGKTVMQFDYCQKLFHIINFYKKVSFIRMNYHNNLTSF